MIELKHVTKRFGNSVILNDINLKFPKYGIVVIYGPSGCGKTTLLNVISSLYEAEGDISFNGRHYRLMKESDKDQLRNAKMGFVFQDYKLFEFETVKSNLMLSINLKCNDKTREKNRRVDDLLKIVGLADKTDELVSNLSGGEKQRVAIARAICNSPSVLLADEPTGNLDEKNSKMVMSLIEKISKSTLIIMVSHDQQLTKEYADQIVYMEDGKIKNIEYNNHNRHVDVLPLIHLKPKENKPSLSLSFCFHHSFNNIKRRKWRSMLVFLTTSLGLIGVGLGSVLTNIISYNLTKSYSSIIDSNKVIVEPKEKSGVSKLITSLNYEDVSSLREEYKDYISNTGIYYCNDLEKFFTSYDFNLVSGSLTKTLPEYTIRSINEYDSLTNCKGVIYPLQITSVEDDEVVLGLTYPMVNEICYQLFIKRNVESLSNYLKSNDLYIEISLSNYNWQYSSNFRLKVAGFTLTTYNFMFHSNPLWNEYIFEERCNFSTTDIINTNSANPWDLKKVYYFDFKYNRDVFLKDMKFSKTYNYVISEILNSNYYPLLYKNTDNEHCSRVGLFSKANEKGIGGYLSSYFRKVSKHVNGCLYGSKLGYVIYPESLMMGFSNITYLSNDINYINDTIDLTAYIKYQDSMNVNLPDNVISGHFTKSKMNGLVFNPNYQLISGVKPTNYNEIVLSKGVIQRLKIDNPLYSTIYLSFPLKEEILPNGYLSRDFKTVGLKVVGVSNSEKIEISHAEEWSIMFFQTMLGISNFNLDIESVALDIDENYENEVISKMEVAFPFLKATSPISSVKDSINTICRYIEIILLILSVSSIVIASFLLSICNYLHFVEIKKDIGLVRCIGVSKEEANKFIYCHSLLMSLVAFALATLQLFVICLFLSKALSEVLLVESTFIFNPLSLVYMLGVSLGISFLSSIFIRNKVNLLDPLECLR